jgi:hypothetical protein
VETHKIIIVGAVEKFRLTGRLADLVALTVIYCNTALRTANTEDTNTLIFTTKLSIRMPSFVSCNVGLLSQQYSNADSGQDKTDPHADGSCDCIQ